MTTWATLLSQVQTDLTDPAGVFHDSTAIRRYLEQAELLLTLRRSLYERTQTLLFDTTIPLYPIHAIFPDFIRPLRVTVAGVALRWSSLADVGRLNRAWWREFGEVESVFMVGKTLLGFAPLPDAVSAEVTYLAMPPTTISTPVAGTSPMIGTEWHVSLSKYAQAVALGKEGSYTRAAEALKEFFVRASITRDPRFLENLAQNTAQQVIRQPERSAND